MADLDGRISEYERDHFRALARELTYAAGCPLRDRYGFAAADDRVDVVLTAVLAFPGDPGDAAAEFGSRLLDNPLAMSTEVPTDEAYELRIAAALQPLAAEYARRQEADRG